MKNLIKFSTLTTLLSVVFFSSPLVGGDKKMRSEKKDSLYCIEIDGKVLIPKSDNSKLYKIELLCHNDVVDSGIVVDDESFLLKVKKNSWYTIRIVKEGYFPLVISIDTRLPEYTAGNYRFHFDTELIVENYLSVQDDDAVDFPIAIVTFDQNRDQFLPIKQYSKNIRRSLFDLPVVKEGFAKN